MENALGEDFPVGLYRTDDKIKNFKIRVKLRKIPNACFTKKDSLAFGNSNELELVNLMKASSISVEHIFSWQEKVDLIDEVNNAKVKGTEDAENDSLTICLFSYTESDILSSEWKKTMYTSSTIQNHLVRQMIKCKPKTLLNLSYTETWQRPFSNIKRIIKQKKNVTDVLLPIGKSMILMASLCFKDSSNSEEIDLCFLQVDDHGTLTVIPDFNKRKAYTFMNSRSEIFEYELENASRLLKVSAIQREKYLMKKIASYKAKLREDIVDAEFIKLTSGSVSFTINCEIVSAKNFLSSDLFVHYLVVLPKVWSSENNLEGVTETCRCKVRNDDKIAYYGYTFSFNTLARIESYSEESLKVIFEITSVDYWGNFRNEGYGYADIMPTPGAKYFEICTWKIEPTTLCYKLQNFFIGGKPHLEDLSYVVTPTEAKDSQLSKYGVWTLSSGKVTFKTFVIQQKNPIYIS